MHPSVRYGSQFAAATLRTSSHKSKGAPSVIARAVSEAQTPWTCADCRFKLQTRTLQTKHATSRFFQQRRSITNSARRLDDRVDVDVKRPVSPTSTATASTSTETQSTSSSLPSHVEKRRWQLSKDMTKFVDELLARASIAGQHINEYTGTDYSGIDALRKEIIAQEQKVREHHRKVHDAKSEHHDSLARQASSQKEIVGLLERKASWSPTDLERYMSLVRSEHSNDHSVQAAKDSLVAAERELEDARSLLERLERKQYHEEQIWSDTIRRNSTWLTFGLMGVNIILLLAQITIFEPYRRRRIVRDVKSALDEKTFHAPSAEVEKQIDEVVPPKDTPIETLAESVKDEAREEPTPQPLDSIVATQEATQQPVDGFVASQEDSGKAALAAIDTLPEQDADLSKTASDASADPQPPYQEEITWESTLKDTWKLYQARFHDLFSGRVVQIKKVEMTTIALQSAATGVAAMGLLFVVLKPR